MIALRVAGVAAVLVMAPAATTAHADVAAEADGGGARADDGVTVTVLPAAAAPGSDVQVHVSGCTGATGAVTSPAFVADAALSGADGSDYQLLGDTTVKSNASDGTYSLSVECQGRAHAGTGKLQVVGAQSTATPAPGPSSTPDHSPAADASSRPEQSDRPDRSPRPDRSSEPSQSHHASPVAPVRAGGGGAAPLAAQPAAEDAGPGTPHTVIGLVLAGVAAVAVALRSARRRRPDGR
ncbi:hypothetical protein AB0M39_29590 [Streptomyces sp. NPDC051907]|uniref:hypothetical protein n=1 Tax=Streptomyces sp. NPDC051907 TaxID=3155284 RepID=UPI00342A51D6